jgi:farnesol dehydrogenase
VRILVTGVTGFLGGRVARALAVAGHDVTGLVRDSAKWVDRPSGIRAVTGDVTDAAAVRAAIDGQEAVIHAAALVKLWVPDRALFERVNVDGLRHVLDAAGACGARVLWSSSFFALGPTDGTTLDEADLPERTEFCTDYERSKYLADRLARQVDPARVDLVRLYPGILYGAGALTQGNYLVHLFRQHASGKLPGLLGRTDLRQCYAYVDDVVDGIVAALDRAPAGSGHMLGGENATVDDLFAHFERETGIPPPRLRIPYRVAAWVGRAQRWRAEWFGTEPELTEDAVRVYRHEWAYRSERAQRDLGYRVTSLADGVRATVAWMRDEGLLPDGREGGVRG